MVEKLYCGACNLYFVPLLSRKCPKCGNDEDDLDISFYRSHQWYLQNKPQETKIFKKGVTSQLDNSITYAYALCKNDEKELEKLDYSIPSSHRSKSVDLPVPKYEYRGLTLLWRNNFYDIVVYMKTDLDIPLKIMKAMISVESLPLNYEGIGEYLSSYEVYLKSQEKPQSFKKNPHNCLFYCSNPEWLFGVLGMIARNEIKEG
jgi:hypothetical protein